MSFASSSSSSSSPLTSPLPSPSLSHLSPSSQRYLRGLHSLHSLWNDFPPLHIEYRNLHVTHNKSGKSPSESSTPLFHSLYPTSGVIRPGTLTLLLGPPGCGRSTFLKTLTKRGEKYLEKGDKIGGRVLYNGVDIYDHHLINTVSTSTSASLHIDDIHLRLPKLSSYVDQSDIHMARLTVNETLQFVADNSLPQIDILLQGNNDIQLRSQITDFHTNRVSLLIDTLNLTECKDTMLGNAIVRGCSGGQIRRTTLAEGILGNHRILCLDSITDGLDSAISIEIIKFLKMWANITGGAVVLSLNQPSPEMVKEMDEIILMKEGRVVYKGKGGSEDMGKYLLERNIPIPDYMDTADFLVEFLSQPKSIWARTVRRGMRKWEKREKEMGGKEKGKEGEGKDYSSAIYEKLKGGMRKKYEEKHHQRENNKMATIDNDRKEAVYVTVKQRGMDVDGNGNGSVSSAIHHSVHIHEDNENENNDINMDIHPVDTTSATPSPPTSTPPTDISYLHLLHCLHAISPSSVLPPLTIEDMVSEYENSINYENEMEELRRLEGRRKELQRTIMPSNGNENHFNLKGKGKGSAVLSLSPYTLLQYYSDSHSFFSHLRSNIRRQYVYFTRNIPLLFIPRLIQCMFISFVLGSLFYQIAPSSFLNRAELLVYCPIYLAFSNFAETPITTEQKRVVYKHLDGGYHNSLAYVMAINVIHFLLIVPETMIMSVIVYFMTGFAFDAGRFFFFYFVLLSANMCYSGIFRLISYVNKSEIQAQAMAAPISALSLLYSGVLIAKDKIPDFLIEFYYISPVRWTSVALLRSEFSDPRYDDGEEYLAELDVPYDFQQKWGTFGVLIGYWILGILLGSLAMTKMRWIMSMGTKRYEKGEGGQDGENGVDSMMMIKSSTKGLLVKSASDKDNKEMFHASSLPFKKMNLTFSNIKYTVKVTETKNVQKISADASQEEKMDIVPKKNGKGKLEKITYDRILLRHVSGHVKAGELVALVGSSGAGKTTLMDVLAGRKDEGVVEGEILINGHPIHPSTTGRIFGYVEQFARQLGTQTVREALYFSANLRLPQSTPPDVIDRWIDELLSILELTHMSNRIIGDPLSSDSVDCISPAELKILSIGIELCANPSILFLDEPTTNQDSSSAGLIMRVIKRITMTGRTVLCTIHQPSAELFSMFDRLLLLQSGGWVSYFGPVGDWGDSVEKYFIEESRRDNSIIPVDGRPQPAGSTNVAEWMINVILNEKAKDKENNNQNKEDEGPSWYQLYNTSTLQKENEKIRGEINNGNTLYDHDDDSSLSIPIPTTRYVSSPLSQFYYVFSRMYLNYKRNTTYMSIRIRLMIVLGIFVGLSYLNISDSDEPGIISKISSQFMGIGFGGLLMSASLLPRAFIHRYVIVRESKSSYYNPLFGVLALAMMEIPHVLGTSLFFIIPFYFIVGFQSSAPLFFQYVLAHFLVSYCWALQALLWSIIMPNLQIASLLSGAFHSFTFLFGGLVIQFPSMPIGYRWLYYIFFLSKGVIATNISQYSCDGFDIPGNPNECPTVTVQNPEGGGELTITKAEFLSMFLGRGFDGYWQWIGWLVLEAGVFLSIAMLFSLKFKGKSKVNENKNGNGKGNENGMKIELENVKIPFSSMTSESK